MRFNTSLLHGAEYNDQTGSTTVPIYQATAFTHQSPEEMENIFKGSEAGYLYTRINNPTVAALERKIANLEKGIGALACASGMAAVTLAVLNILQQDDEILSGSGLFGGTYSLFRQLESYGIQTVFAADHTLQSFADKITPKTRLIYVETIGNPRLDVPNISELSNLAHQNGIPLIVDNTVTSPYLFNPVDLGADIIIHSTSKYLNGSGNSIGGIIIDGGKFKWDLGRFPGLKDYAKFGPFMYLAKLRQGIFRDFGACVAPFNAYLTMLGIETLGLRVERACTNALRLAEFFSSHPQVVKVNYPGLSSHPDYAIAVRQFRGQGGAILTIRTGSKEKAYEVISKLKLVKNVTNIGDVKTLVIHPASTIYAALSSEEKEEMGVYDDLIRISVGIEDIEDLIEDFAQAL